MSAARSSAFACCLNARSCSVAAAEGASSPACVGVEGNAAAIAGVVAGQRRGGTRAERRVCDSNSKPHSDDVSRRPDTRRGTAATSAPSTAQRQQQRASEAAAGGQRTTQSEQAGCVPADKRTVVAGPRQTAGGQCNEHSARQRLRHRGHWQGTRSGKSFKGDSLCDALYSVPQCTSARYNHGTVCTPRTSCMFFMFNPRR